MSLFAICLACALLSALLSAAFTVAAFARAIVRLARGLLPMLILVGLSGCAHPIDGVIVALDGTQATLTATHDILEMRLDAARKAAVAASPDKASAERAVAAVEAKFAPVLRAYHDARLAWVEAAALARAAQIADASGKSPALAAAQRASGDVEKALASMAGSLEATK
jgi:hypothetical protein